MNYEVIMFNMSSYTEWQHGVVNRNYHVFNYLLKNKDVDRVIAIDFLPFTFKRAIRNYWENIIKGTTGKVVYRDLTTRCVKIDRKGAELYIFSTIDSVFSHKRVIRKLNKVFKRSSKLSRIVYSCFPMFVDYFSNIKTDLTIFDTVDNWIEHPSFKKYQNVLRKNYKIISEKSDLIFTVSEGLKEFFEKQGRVKNVYWAPNGVDVNHFTPSIARTAELNSITDPSGQFSSDVERDVLKGITSPIIGYLGTIQHRFDVDLLEYLAENNPKKSFVLVGPIWQSDLKEKLKRHKNVYLLGRVPHSQAPNYINCFDVAIIPHKIDKFIKSTYSLKLLEYLSCGRPVVTTPTPETKGFQDVIYIARDYEDFNKKINLALKEDNILLRDKRAKRVKGESWEIKIGKMMEKIDNFV